LKRSIYILCGGKSSRMGSDKVLLEAGDLTLLDLLINKALPYFAEVILLSNGRQYRHGLIHLNDSVKGFGPLGGLLAAFQHASHEDIAVAAVDLPLLSENTLQKLSFLDLKAMDEAEPLTEIPYYIGKKKLLIDPNAHIPGLVRHSGTKASFDAKAGAKSSKGGKTGLGIPRNTDMHVKHSPESDSDEHHGGDKDQYQTVILRDDDILQPLAGVYHLSCLPLLEQYVEEGRRSVNGFLERVHTGTIEVSPGELANVNTPQEYQEAVARLQNGNSPLDF
jgi:molybdopterin-guanine dinucleotide biosynthesis protein A